MKLTKTQKSIYYLLQFTWGIIMNIFGLIGAGIMLALGHKPIRHGGSLMFVVGENWGGVSLGMFTFVSNAATERTRNHEFGHSLQNAVFGPLFPFIVAIPSFIRCQQFNSNIKKGIPNKEPYDAIWFEGQATEWGTKEVDKW